MKRLASCLRSCLLALGVVLSLFGRVEAQATPTCFGSRGDNGQTQMLLQQILATQQQIAQTQNLILQLLQQKQGQQDVRPIVIEYRGRELPAEPPRRELPPEGPNRELPGEGPKRELPPDPPKKELPADDPPRTLPVQYYQKFTTSHGDHEWRPKR